MGTTGPIWTLIDWESDANVLVLPTKVQVLVRTITASKTAYGFRRDYLLLFQYFDKPDSVRVCPKKDGCMFFAPTRTEPARKCKELLVWRLAGLLEKKTPVFGSRKIV